MRIEIDGHFCKFYEDDTQYRDPVTPKDEVLLQGTGWSCLSCNVDLTFQEMCNHPWRCNDSLIVAWCHLPKDSCRCGHITCLTCTPICFDAVCDHAHCAELNEKQPVPD